MSIKQTIYWHLPYRIKTYAAYLSTKSLTKERFGESYVSAKKNIQSREMWSHDKFLDYQRSRLQLLIEHCANHVPYYRDLFKSIGLDPRDIRDQSDLEHIPILEKQTLRERGKELIDERVRLTDLKMVSTSGTTGTPLNLYRNIREFSTAFAYNGARHWSVAGLERIKDRSVSIGGKLVAHPHRSKPPYWLHNSRWKQLYMSSYHLTWNNLPHYVDAIRNFQPRYIEAYPSSAYAVAQYIIESKIMPLQLDAVFTTAETILPHQREAIEAAFQCTVHSQYGCAEQAVYAATCKHQAYHVSLDHSILELLDDQGKPCSPGQIGEVVGTSLESYTQPILRYRVGDMASWGKDQCSCGLALPVLAEIGGRKDDLLITPDGRSIGRLDTIFKGLSHIREAQIIQEKLDLIKIRIVPDEGYKPKHGQVVRANLISHIGSSVTVEVCEVERIERTSSGKFRAVVSRIGFNESKGKIAGKEA